MAAPSVLAILVRKPASPMAPAPVSAMLDLGRFNKSISGGSQWAASGLGDGSQVLSAATTTLTDSGLAPNWDGPNDFVGELWTTPINIRDAAGVYEWVNTGMPTGTYYCRATGGGAPAFGDLLIDAYTQIEIAGSDRSRGAYGLLAANQWDYVRVKDGTVEFDTIVVRLTGDADPDGQADGHVKINRVVRKYTAGTVAALTPGQYAISGTSLYVRCFGDADPDALDIRYGHSVAKTGSGQWEDARIVWSLIREDNGGAFPAGWKTRYAEVPDPRQPAAYFGNVLDLSAAMTGFNVGLCVNEGDYHWRATVTNRDGESTSVDSATFTVAANTRTKKYVNSATGMDEPGHGGSAEDPYGTLEYALTQHGTEANVEYILAANHDESTSAANAYSATGANCWIHGSGDVGTRPVIGADTSAAANAFLVVPAGNGGGMVVEDLELVPYVVITNQSGAAVGIYKSDCAFVNVRVDGDGTSGAGNRFQAGWHFWAAQSGTILHKCHHAGAYGWAIGYQSLYTTVQDADANRNRMLCVTGGEYHGNFAQALWRATNDVWGVNFFGTILDSDGASDKSCFRATHGHWITAAYASLEAGDFWLGTAGGSELGLFQARVEHCRIAGTSAQSGKCNSYGRVYGAAFYSNLVVVPDARNAWTITGNASTGGNVHRLKICGNTFDETAQTGGAGLFDCYDQAAVVKDCEIFNNLFVATSLWGNSVPYFNFRSGGGGIASGNNLGSNSATTGSTFWGRVVSTTYALAAWNAFQGTTDYDGVPALNPTTAALEGSTQRVPRRPGLLTDYNAVGRSSSSQPGAVEVNQSPEPVITGGEGSYTEGTAVPITGTAVDFEDGTLTDSLVWTSDLDGALGTGGSINPVLSVGTHTVTAGVTDSGGRTAADSIIVTIIAAPAVVTPSPLLIRRWAEGCDFENLGFGPIGTLHGLYAGVGLHWTRPNGAHVLYRSTVATDFGIPVGSTDKTHAQPEVVKNLAGYAFAPSTRYYFRLVPVGLGGVELRGQSATIIITTDENGVPLPAVPNPPFGLHAVPVAGGVIALNWGYDPTAQQTAPYSWNVYHDDGLPAGPFILLANVTAMGYLTPGYPDGTSVRFRVRAVSADGDEESNTDYVTAVADDSAPDDVGAPTITDGEEF